MENRWSGRKDLELGVDIYHQDQKLGTCLSRDIALGGTYIDLHNINADHDLDIDANVELVFHISDGVTDTKYSLHAKVVRVEGEGIGLKFYDFDTVVFRSLQNLMSYNGAGVLQAAY